MKNVQGFKIDDWIRVYGDNSRFSLEDPDLEVVNRDVELSYGSFEGSLELREGIAALNSSEESKITTENIIITPGSIMANYLVLDTICHQSDHVICQHPTYGQLYLVPQFNGVEVSLWKMDEENEWLPSIDELETLIRPNTKAIILNTPNNPTGAVLKEDFLSNVIKVASSRGIFVFSDEVFNPLVFTSPKPPSLVTLGYEHSVATGSLSKAFAKAFAIPGIRLGWIVTKNEKLFQKITIKRDFTTIAVLRLDDSVASFALNPTVMPKVMERNLSLCRERVLLLEDFVNRNKTRVRWVKPEGSGMAFIRILSSDGEPIDDAEFCKKLKEEESICLVPGGHCFGDGDAGDFKGYVRITLGNPILLREALPLLGKFIQKQ
ncbi:Aminotran-1-2 domain-containing protein [Fusarium sp. LHS14.1]|nr:Aminotran-1-2 domain-containing protein [Fusarium sp. LHS14.1]